MDKSQWECVGEYFSFDEMKCKCGCDRADMDYHFMLMLFNARKSLGHPLTVTSGYRCPEHNKKIGGAKGSKHMQGIAADIAMPTHRLNPFLNYIFAPADGFVRRRFGGIGVSLKGRAPFVHIDSRPNEAYWQY